MNGIKITRIMFADMHPQAQLIAIFDSLEDLNKKVGALEDLNKNMNTVKKTNAIITAATGFLGGIGAVLGKYFFLK